MDKLIDQHKSSTIGYGSELRPMDQLDLLLGYHPDFEEFKSNHEQGIDYPLDPIDDETRLKNLHATIERGNHQSALDEDLRHHVTKGVLSDIQLGYGFPIPIECIPKIEGAEVYPMGVQNQLTISEFGEIIPKKRVTHDLSHNRRAGESVNQRVRTDELPECKFGHSFVRFLHLIHHIRWLHPNQPILANKFDIEKAYRRLHVRGWIAAKCIAIWFLDKMWQDGYHASKEKVGVVLGRLPFGSSPAPSKFSITSEIIFDLGDDLLNCGKWNPSTLPSPYSAELPEPTFLEDDIPFGKAEEADVKLDPNCKGGVDGYIDDGGTAVLASPSNWGMVLRARQAVAMAIFLIFRPLAGLFEPIERPDPASIRKMKAEGGLAELITYLGWLIDTRRFIVALPIDKWVAWSANIREIKAKRTVSYQEISTLIGRLNHVCFIIPDARHFMSNLRRMEKIAKYNLKVHLTSTCLDDLDLWLEFLNSAKDGISINRIVFRSPTLISLSDASEQGIGGYSPSTGIGWRYEFSKDEQRAFTLNLKEFIASTIDAAVQAKHDPSNSPFPCHLGVSDSTTTVGWLRKSNFDEDERPIHNEVARWQARNTMERDGCNYSQHLPGVMNVVADSLSRDFHLSNEQIFAMLTSIHPSLPPSKLKVIELPNELISWIASLAQRWPGHRELPSQPIESEIARGISGWTSSTESESRMIPTWTTSAIPKKFESAVHSCMQLDKVISGEVENSITQLWQTRLERPSILWQRPSSRVIGKAQ